MRLLWLSVAAGLLGACGAKVESDSEALPGAGGRSSAVQSGKADGGGSLGGGSGGAGTGAGGANPVVSGGKGGAAPDPRPTVSDAGTRGDGPVVTVVIPPSFMVPTGGQSSAPPPWRGKDIGEPSLMPGQSMSAPSSFFFKFGGKGIGGTADSFYFSHQPLKGDGEILVKVGMITALPMSRVGIMMRASLEPGAAHVMLTFPTEQGGWNLYARKTAAGPTEALKNIPYNKDWQWMRLIRKGNTVTAIRSQGNINNPSTVGSVDLPFMGDVFVGLAMENAGDSQAGTLDLSDVQINNFNSESANAAWLHDDVLAVGGTAIFSAGVLTLSGWGDPPSKDRLRFSMVHKALMGTQTVTARLMGQTAMGANARSGVIVRDSEVNTSGRRQGATSGGWIYATSAGGLVFETRSTKGGDPVKGGMVADMKPPVWLRVEAVDVGAGMRKFTGSASKDGQQWMTVGTATIVFMPTIATSFGVFSGSGDYTMMNTATFESVTILPGM